MAEHLPPSSALAAADAAHRAGRLDEAESLYGAVLADVPDHAAALFGLGAVYLQGRRFAPAVDLLSRAHGADPSAPPIRDALRAAHNNWANALQAGGDPSAALGHYAAALDLIPGHARTLYNLGTALQSLGRHGEARDAYLRSAAADPGFAPVWLNLGIASLETGHPQDAADCFTRALDLDPGQADARIDLGLAHAQMGDLDAARECALLAQAMPGASPHALGLLLAKCGLADQAAAALSRALAADPSDVRGSGVILAALGARDAPARASDAHIAQLYAAKAQSWDQGAQSAQPYAGHREVARAVQTLCPSGLVLDAGCGTGLVGALLPASYRVEGVDLSPPMLDRARAKNRYDLLECADLTAFMLARPNRYDIVAAAATLIHFRDLAPPLRAAGHALKPQGWMVFTAFPSDGTLGLNGHAEGGCYQHAPQDIAACAADCGFAVHAMETVVHEYRHGSPVPALLVTLRKTGGADQ